MPPRKLGRNESGVIPSANRNVITGGTTTMSINVGAFIDSVNFAADKQVPEFTKELADKIMRELARGIVRGTPVDTGEAKGEWQMGVNFVPSTPTGRKDKVGENTLAAIRRRIRTAPPFSTYHLTNLAKHIGALERGHSPQSPPGAMVAGNLAKIRAKYG